MLDLNFEAEIALIENAHALVDDYAIDCSIYNDDEIWRTLGWDNDYEPTEEEMHELEKVVAMRVIEILKTKYYIKQKVEKLSFFMCKRY